MNIVIFSEKLARVSSGRATVRVVARSMQVLLACLSLGFAGMAKAVLLPPTAAMEFAPSTIFVGKQNLSQMTITLTNPNPQQIGGVAFSDDYPSAGFRNFSLTENTCGGTIQLTTDGSNVSLVGGTIQGNSSCEVTVKVWGLTEGQWQNTTGPITSLDTPQGNGASASLTVNRFAAPSVTETFLPADIRPGATAQLQVTLVNPNISDITGVHIGDGYPSGMTNVSGFLPIISNTCGGTLIPPPGANAFVFDGGVIPANGSCTIAIAVTASATGTNSTGAVTSANAIDGDAASSTLTVTPGSVLVAPGVAPVFASNNLSLGQTTDFTITISNPNGQTPITGLQLHDAFPAILRNASGGDAFTSNTCGGTLSAPPGGTSLDLVNGSVPAGSCVIKVRVVAYAVGSNVSNAVGAVASANAATTFPVANVLNVAAAPTLNAPTLAKSFNPSTIAVGETSQMTITLTNDNANAAPIVGLNIFDAYPQGMANAPSGALLSNDCGGSIGSLGDGFTGTKAMILNGGMVPRLGSCSIVVKVVGTQIGTSILNSVTASSSNSQSPNGATATLTVTASAPIVTKSFSPASVTQGGVSEMSITIENPNVQAITGVSFTDVYPAGIANLPGGAGVLVNNTCNGNLAALPLGTSLALSGGTIAASGSCKIDIAVVATASGTVHNVTGPVASADAPTASGGSADLVVSGGALQPAPSVVKSFSLPSVTSGGTSQMTITLTNAGGQDIFGAQISDPYPAGIVNSPNGIGGNDVVVANTCGGVVSAPINASTASLTGGTIPANHSCSFVVNVIGSATATNLTDQVFSANAGAGAPASATLTVMPGPLLNAPSVDKQFLPQDVNVGSPSQMTITLGNSNATAIVGAQINDLYPSGMSNAASNPVASDTCGFTEDVPISGSWAKFANGTIPPGGCSVVVNVVGTKAGVQANITGFVPSANAQTGLPDSAILTVTAGAALPAPTVAMTFLPATALVGGTAQLKVSISNSDPAKSITGVAFTDDYPVPLHMANANNGVLVSNTCGGTVTADPGDSRVSLANGVVAPSKSCYVVVNVVGTSQGASVNHTGPVTSQNANPGTDASATLTITAGNLRPAPSVTKSFSPPTIAAGGASQMTIALTSHAPTVMTSGVQISDLYPSGLSNGPNAIVSDTCNFVHDVPDGGTYAKLANGSIAPGATCSIVINVTATSTVTNNTGPIPSANAHTASSAPATLAVSGGAAVADMTIAKTHSGNFTQGQVGATYTLTATNAGGAATSGIVTVTDTLPSALTATGIAGVGWTCDLQTLQCTRSDPAAPGASYPPITLTVTATASGNVVNHATVGGGGETNAANDGVDDATTIDPVSAGSDLVIAKSHVGNFVQGQTGAVYTLIAQNIGGVPTSGQVSVTDTLPASLTATGIVGPGWTCTLATLACTRSDSLAAGASFPAISLTVDVQPNAPSSVINTAAVGGGGETNAANDSAADTTTIDSISSVADLAVTKIHSGNFVQGQTGAIYTLIAHNVGNAATVGSVTLGDTLPPSMVATDMSGSGWTCDVSTTICSRNSVLAAGASYPPITLTVNVAANAPPTAVNTANVEGGGETNVANDSANDPTTIDAPSANPDLTIAKSHVGNFVDGQTGAVYTLVARNLGSSATSGQVTVTDTLPASLTATSINGPGWTCTLATLACTRNDALASGASYPAITLTVDVQTGAPQVVVNNATVGGGGETNTANDTAADTTNIDGSGNGPDLTLSKSHQGDFAQGQTGATYTLIVHNIGNASTVGGVTVTDTLPASLVATGMTGSGWVCNLATTTCTKASVLPAGGSYPPITLTVDVSSSAPPSVVNTATVSGGLETNTANDSASDPTTIDSAAGNHAPSATGDAIEVTALGTSSDLVGDPGSNDSVLDNDLDIDADSLTAVKLTDPTHGTLTQFNADGTFVYQTNSNSGTDSFTYKACDPFACSAPATVSITIGAGLDNHIPFATDDAIEVAPGVWQSALVGDLSTIDSVIDNDVDPDGDALTASKLTDPSHGSLTLNADGTFVYQNDAADPATSDVFLYAVCDSHGACDHGTVSITVSATANDRLPIVVDDAIQVAPGQSITSLIGDLNSIDSLLDNDRDPDTGDTLTALKMSPLLNASGDFVLNADGTFQYQNTDLLASSDILLYEACDESGGCTSGVVTISINNNPLDRAPIPTDDAIIVGPNGTATTLVGGAASVLTNDTDPDTGETATLKAHLISAPTNGHIALNPDGTFIYVNDDPAPGVDVLQYEACDDEGACVAATVHVTIDGAAPTIACQLPPQLEVVGDVVTLDLSMLFTPPAGATLSYSGANLPPSLAVTGSLLSGTIQSGAEVGSPYASTLTATTVPGGVSASQGVTFRILAADEILLRDGFDGNNPPPPPCP
jgi:uncharacterized repeat protein (TIGR01451 family)